MENDKKPNSLRNYKVFVFPLVLGSMNFCQNTDFCFATVKFSDFSKVTEQIKSVTLGNHSLR